LGSNRLTGNCSFFIHTPSVWYVGLIWQLMQNFQTQFPGKSVLEPILFTRALFEPFSIKVQRQHDNWDVSPSFRPYWLTQYFSYLSNNLFCEACSPGCTSSINCPSGETPVSEPFPTPVSVPTGCAIGGVACNGSTRTKVNVAYASKFYPMSNV